MIHHVEGELIGLFVEALGVADAVPVLDLYLAAASVPGSGLARARDEMDAAYVEGFLDRSSRSGITLGAFLDGRLAGEIHAVRPGPRQFAHVLSDLTVAVHPDFQGEGVGSALFTALLQRAGAIAPAILRVELVARSGNLRALILYERLGFVEEGRLTRRVLLPDGRLEDDVLMARSLLPRPSSA